ncbi:MAG: hypothetical protein ACTIDI_01135 [Pseudolactococcus laudensis]
MKNTTQTTQEELVMRTLITELKIMNLKLDMLEQEIDEREKEMDGLNEGINKLGSFNLISNSNKIYGGFFVYRIR